MSKGVFDVFWVLGTLFVLVFNISPNVSLANSQTYSLAKQSLESESAAMASLNSKKSKNSKAHLDLASLNASKEFQKFLSLKQASFALYHSDWTPLYVNKQNLPLIPASTTKILTAYLALQHWGSDYKFYTDFVIEPLPLKKQVASEYLPAGKKANSRRASIWIKGYGDPFLTSEEIVIMAKQLHQQLKRLGIKEIVQVNLDSRFYQSKIAIPGASHSDNPYDAIPSAIAANFNTAFIKWNGKGWQTAEPQTPLTQVAIAAANRRFLPAGREAKSLKPLKKGFKARINLGFDPKNNEKHFVQLLLALLEKQDDVNFIETQQAKIQWQAIKDTQLSQDSIHPEPQNTVKWRYRNSKSLQQVLVPMLKYSTNFIANQLALNLAAEHYSLPAGENLVARYYQEMLQDWLTGANFEEGAGLSRDNQVTAAQLSLLLRAFASYRQLLPKTSKGVYAKSGTLHGVTTLAGFIDKQDASFPFVLMVNEPVAYKYRNRFIQAIRRAIDVQP